jgi:hypothetical protein
MNPRSDSAWLSALRRRVLHARHLKCAIGRPCQSYDCVRRAWRGSLRPNGSALVRVPSAGLLFRRRRASIAGESRRDPRSPVNSPRLRAAKLCSVRVMLFRPSRPSVGSARKGRGLEPLARSIRLGRVHRAGGVPPVESTAPAPQSTPVTPPLASRRKKRRRWHPGRESWPQGQLSTDCTPIAGVHVNQTEPARLVRGVRASADFPPAVQPDSIQTRHAQGRPTARTPFTSRDSIPQSDAT